MMKRYALNTVALAVAGVAVTSGAHAAEKIDFDVHGALYNAFTVQGVTQSGSASFQDTNVRQDAIIEFSGESVLDNGLKVGGVANFEIMTSDGDRDPSAEDLYMTVGGKFGDIYVGQRRNAATVQHVFLPSAGLPNMGIDDSRISPYINPVSAIGRTYTTALSMGITEEYAARVEYFTPRMAGFQLGVSFTPNGDANNDFQTGFRPELRNEAFSTAVDNEVSIGASYSRNFGKLSADLAGGYTFAETREVNRKDPKEWQVSAALGYSGFTLGGAYADLKNEALLGNTKHMRAYGVGMKYETGPWTFGASALESRHKGGVSATSGIGFDSDRVRLYEAGFSYVLGAGVTTGVGVYYNENNQHEGDSLAGAVALGLNF
jgi:predicted porin